jgi:hypothetical protein
VTVVVVRNGAILASMRFVLAQGGGWFRDMMMSCLPA